jgi:hypothetical protein
MGARATEIAIQMLEGGEVVGRLQSRLYPAARSHSLDAMAGVKLNKSRDFLIFIFKIVA